MSERTLLWTRDSVTINLTDPANGWREQNGATGLDLPPIEIPAESVLGVDGLVAGRRIVREREISIPMLLQGSSRADFQAKFALLMSALGGGRPGRLRAVTPAADRYLDAHFIEGLAGDDALEAEGGTWWRGMLQFRAFSPYWQDSSATAVYFKSQSGRKFFPLRVNGSGFGLNANATFGTYITPVAGDAPAWPTIRVDGPFTSFSIRTDDDREFILSREVPVGGSVWVFFDPLAKMLLGVNSSSPWTYSLTDAIVWPSQTWPIERSGQRISVTVNGGAGTTQAIISWSNRWHSWRSV